MANAVASYDQLAHQVEVLRKENSHLRRELEDNSNHLSKLETETFGMKEVLKQLQSKLEQEAGTLASSGRSDVLHQLKELHMDLTNYYELKHQPHNLRLLTDSLGRPGLTGAAEVRLEDRLALPPSACSSSSSVAAMSRASCPLRAASRQSAVSGGEAAAIMLPHHFLDGAPPKTAVISGADGRLSDHHLEELYKERNLLLGEIDREERERCWYFSQLEVLSQRLAQLPRIDTFSLQMDLIRQQLEFEAQQVRSVMEERFGTSDEMVQRTQMRVARLEQLEIELQEARGSQENQLQLLVFDGGSLDQSQARPSTTVHQEEAEIIQVSFVSGRKTHTHTHLFVCRQTHITPQGVAMETGCGWGVESFGSTVRISLCESK
uniref:Adenomatous polyposis coli N-terminal dimerisation domain-containing protein n=1 Tax=Monopterus albus TaxID=43700 RepID=A0A3Q3R9F8_MONAL